MKGEAAQRARNRTRARRAREGLKAYRKDPAFCRPHPDTVRTSLVDLLTDLLHYLGPETVSDSLRIARNHYASETSPPQERKESVS